MSNELSSLISDWVKLDNEIKEMNIRIKELREKRTEKTMNVHKYMSDANILNSKIEINDSELKMGNTVTYSTITFKNIENSLIKYIDDTEIIKEIILDIKNNRNSKTSVEFKRKYKKVE